MRLGLAKTASEVALPLPLGEGWGEELLATVPAEAAARPLSESACPMVKRG